MGKGLRKMFELGLKLKRVNNGGWCRQKRGEHSWLGKLYEQGDTVAVTGRSTACGVLKH